MFSPTLTCVPAVEAAGALKAGDAFSERAGRISRLLRLALQLADCLSKDFLHILKRVSAGSSQHQQERLPVAYQENTPPPASKHPPPSPKPVKPALFNWQTLRSLVPLESADEPLVLKSPPVAWLISLVGNCFHKGSLHARKPIWKGVLQNVHATTSERPGVLVSSHYTAPWLCNTICYTLKEDGVALLTRWSAPVAQLEGHGHSLPTVVSLELISFTKLFLKRNAAAHNLLALLLAYAENELFLFGATLEWERRKLENRSAKRPGDELFPVGLAVRNQKRRSLHVPLGALHVDASALAATQVGGIRRAENPQPDFTPAEAGTSDLYPGVGLCCQPGSYLMPARPTEKNKYRGCYACTMTCAQTRT
jgi:hypothetical protein